MQVTDNDTGVTELASPEQSKAFRKQRGKEYLDALAQANNPDNYKPGAAPIALQAPQAPVVAPPRAAAAPEGVTAPAAPALAQVSAPAAPVVASISAPPVSVAPTAPTIAEAPPVAVPMASADTKKVAAVSPPTQEAGQDLKDRRIAHIVTGGLSST